MAPVTGKPFSAFLRREAPWLGAGALMAFASSFGQTFFISIFAGVWREEFDLGHGEWGLLYMVATLTSAIVLTQAGRLADVLPARRLALIVLAALTFVAIGISAAPAWPFLAVLVFGLRFCGQGMMSHIAITSMGKWYRAERGRAIAIASLGFAFGEAILPALGLSLIAFAGWRGSWLLIAAGLVLLIGPALAWLLRRERTPQSAGEISLSPGMGGRHWTRGEMLRHWVFLALIPGLLGPSWVGTVIFFQTVHLTGVKGWDILTYAGLAFPAFSVAAILSSFFYGWAADRFGAVRLLPVYLLAHGTGAILISLSDGITGGILALAVLGLGSGAVGVVIGALIADLYGARWLGGIRALITAISVLASALGPGVSGLLLDLDVGIEAQCAGMGVYLFATSLWFIVVSHRARKLLPARE